VAEALLTVNALFDRSVLERGDAVAVKDANREYSYRELTALVGALAREMRDRGVGRGDAVAIYADRTAHVVAAILAILRAGAAFVPVSLDTPPARLAFFLSDANPSLLLTDRLGRDQLAGLELRIGMVAIDTLPPTSGRGDGPAVAVSPDDLAYIIYTSGTTGRPKGVMIEHGSIARRFHDWDSVYSLSGSRCRCLQLAKLGFDVFTADLVKALCAGGVLVLCPSDAVLDPAQLYRWLVEEAIDYVEMVPAVLRKLMEYLEASGQDLAGLGMINCGADLWSKDEYKRCRRVTKVSRLFNTYGVTECAVESTVFEDDGVILDRKTTLPIGRALASDEILIVDEALDPVAPGVSGQICIGGPCVSRGYLNRPELNRLAFFSRAGRDGEIIRYYKTGDLGRVDADQVIEFLGRLDSQVKIHGHRVELEEVERTLERYPPVRQAVVCFDSSQQTLIAHVRTVDGKPLEPSESAAYLARHLPRYMIPKRILVVETFPLSQNGKIDRAKLTHESAAFQAGGAGKRRPHDLHESRNLADLNERLRRRDLDLLSLVREFVKPSSRFGLVIGGELADGAATEVSDLNLLVLLNDGGAMKRRKQEISGNVVNFGPSSGDHTQISLFVDGVKIGLDFMVNAEISLDGSAPGVQNGVAGRVSDDPWRAKLLGWLASGWIVHGREVVERWRHYYQVDHL
jgi:amino acid adenylation domain-containing protein